MKDEDQMRALPIGPVGAVVLLSAACGAGSDRGPVLPSETRDSAGVTIVENERPAPGSRLGWGVGEAPAVSIGTQEGDESDMLFLVSDATRLADGRIVVANAGSSELRVFSADGQYLAAWGGEGEGPGEFSGYTPDRVSRWPGDSIVGEDMFSAQLHVFDGDGNHGRTVTLPDVYHSLLGVMADGTVLVKPSTVFGLAFGAGPLARSDQDFAFLLPGGDVRASLGARPGEEWFVSTSAPAATPHPFGRSTIAAIWGDLAIVAPTDRYELRAYRSDGTLARIVRRDHELKRPTQADVDAWIRGRLAELPEERRERYQAQTGMMTPVEFFPAFEALHSDPLDYIWVKEYNLPGQDQSLWTVFDPSGRVLGQLDLPADLDVYEIGVDYILGANMDELSVERVQLWPLDRNPR